jgi:PAS domain S-box-containing protein
MLFIFIAVIAAIWIIEAAVHVVFFHKQNFFKEVFTIEVHELWMRLFVIIIAAAMGVYIQSLVNKQRTINILQENEKRFRALVEATSDWIWEVDENASYTYAGPKIKDILGYKPEEVLGKTPFDFMPPQEAQRTSVIFSNIKDSKKPIKELENTNIHKDGHLVILETSGTPVFDMDGTFRGYRGIDRDITERKGLEKELLEIEERERRRIGRDLHDGLGQLLSGIAFRCEALGSSLESRLPADAARVLEITSLAEQAKEQTRQITKGLLPVETEKEGLMVALKELASRTQKLFNVSCTLKCSEPIIVSNETVLLYLYRIAQEAVNNAVKHGNSGLIEISLERYSGNVIMQVTDNGIGISDVSAKTEGLGLKIMKYRANMIGAYLDIHSCKKLGTTVVCILPDIIIRKSDKDESDICPDKSEDKLMEVSA